MSIDSFANICQTVSMEDAAPHADVKQKAILKAAFGVFAQYGVRRASMEDIARAAGMSRPALYQHFRNKDDIARSLVQHYFDEAGQAVGRALAEAGRPEQVLERALLAKAGQIKEVLLDSPHGMELLEMGGTVAADIVAEGTARLVALFADWFAAEERAGRLRLDGPPQQVAQTLLAAAEGTKRPPFAAYEGHLVRLARMFGRGLSADRA